MEVYIMARSTLDRLLGKNKNEAKYERYDFKKKYGDKVPEVDDFLKEFDEKLVLVLDKMRKKGSREQRELIKLYEDRAKQFSEVARQLPLFFSGTVFLNKMIKLPDIRFFQREMLARSIQTFDDFIEGNDASKNNEQCLLLARDMDENADLASVTGAFLGFAAVAMLVTAIVLATTVDPIFLIVLLYFTLPLMPTMEILNTIQKSEEGDEAMTSFTESGKSFFSNATEDEIDEPKKEAEKSSRWWPFGGDGDK